MVCRTLTAVRYPGRLWLAWIQLGTSLEPTMVRIYLSGRMTIEGEDALLGPEEFPGPQGRAVFAYLVGERGRPVSRSVLADAVWSGQPPPSWSTSLSALASKLRPLLARVGLDGNEALRGAAGCYELRLPPDVWIDHEAAAAAIHEAETALEADDPGGAYGPSAVALLIARRPFLPGEEARWIEPRRRKLADILVRALECRARIYLWNGEHALAAAAAREVVDLRRFRESGYRLLMRAHLAAGNAAEALWVYERCRDLMLEELGTTPSAETKAVHSEVLASM